MNASYTHRYESETNNEAKTCHLMGCLNYSNVEGHVGDIVWRCCSYALKTDNVFSSEVTSCEPGNISTT